MRHESQLFLYRAGNEVLEAAMKILVGYDGKKGAKAALEVAIQMANVFKARIYILTSLSGRDDSKETFEFIEDDSTKKYQILKKAEKTLEEAGRVLEKTNLAFETHLSNRGLDPGEDIVDFAEKVEADFIVIGIRRKSKVSKLLFGSTAQYVILNAHCPVVTGH